MMPRSCCTVSAPGPWLPVPGRWLTALVVLSVPALVALSAPVLAQTRPVLEAAPVAATQATPAADEPMSAAAVQAANAAGMDSPVGHNSSVYIIGVGDGLQITVWKEPAMSAPGVPVRPDGMISLPLVGDIQASGMTPMTLSQDVAQRLKRYVKDPLVTVSVSSVRPKMIYLVGEVAHVGPITLTGGMTPLQAIASAGGLSAYAKAKSIYILRTSAGGRQEKLPFNYKRAVKDGDMQHISLVAGDTIVVP